jgi:hypothetical protein
VHRNAEYWRALAVELQQLSPAIAGDDSSAISELVSELTEAVIGGALVGPTVDLFGIAAEMRALHALDPMPEDQQTRYLALADILCSWVTPEHVRLEYLSS